MWRTSCFYYRLDLLDVPIFYMRSMCEQQCCHTGVKVTFEIKKRNLTGTQLNKSLWRDEYIHCLHFDFWLRMLSALWNYHICWNNKALVTSPTLSAELQKCVCIYLSCIPTKASVNDSFFVLLTLFYSPLLKTNSGRTNLCLCVFAQWLTKSNMCYGLLVLSENISIKAKGHRSCPWLSLVKTDLQERQVLIQSWASATCTICWGGPDQDGVSVCGGGVCEGGDSISFVFGTDVY